MKTDKVFKIAIIAIVIGILSVIVWYNLTQPAGFGSEMAPTMASFEETSQGTIH